MCRRLDPWWPPEAPRDVPQRTLKRARDKWRHLQSTSAALPAKAPRPASAGFPAPSGSSLPLHCLISGPGWTFATRAIARTPALAGPAEEQGRWELAAPKAQSPLLAAMALLVASMNSQAKVQGLSLTMR